MSALWTLLMKGRPTTRTLVLNFYSNHVCGGLRMDPHLPTIADSSLFQILSGDTPLLLLLCSISLSVCSIETRVLRFDPGLAGRIGRGAASDLDPFSPLEGSILFSKGLRRDEASNPISPRFMDNVIITAMRAQPLGTNPRANLMTESLQLTTLPLACRHGRESSLSLSRKYRANPQASLSKKLSDP